MAVTVRAFDGVQGGSLEFGTATSADPASINAGAVGDFVLTITGAASGDQVFLTPQGLEDGLVVESAVVTTDTVTVKVLNTTASPIDPAAATFDYQLAKNG